MNPHPHQSRCDRSGFEPPTIVLSQVEGRRRVFKRILAGAGLSLLAACGQRGPLYLPDPNDPTKKRS